MLNQGRMRFRRAFTMIELMIVVIIVAILAASAVPLYQGVVSRAYQAEVGTALGVVRSAQRIYYAEHGEYADDIDDLDISADDFRDMQYAVNPEAETLSIPIVITSGSADGFLATWTTDQAGWVAEGDDGFPGDFSTATINQAGTLNFN